jgi:putative superfamily III holin-X
VVDGQQGSLSNGTVDDKSLGDLVSRVSDNASLLIREEIELAKAEVEFKMKSLIRGAAVGAAAGFFVFLALIFFFQGVSWGISDLLGNGYGWAGFFVTTGILLLSAAVAGLLAMRFVKSGTPPTPQQAIEEAKKIREALEHPEREITSAAGTAGGTPNA